MKYAITSEISGPRGWEVQTTNRTSFNPELTKDTFEKETSGHKRNLAKKATRTDVISPKNMDIINAFEHKRS